MLVIKALYQNMCHSGKIAMEFGSNVIGQKCLTVHNLLYLED